MQVSELRGDILVCTKRSADELLRSLSGLAVLHAHGDVRLISMDNNEEAVASILHKTGYRLSPRFMDRFYVETGEDDQSRQALLNSFFSILAPMYRQLIDVDRNLENIDTLLEIVSTRGKSSVELPILDLGCGIGLSQEVAVQRGASLVGVDPCPSMRHFAELSGLTVWSPGHLARLPAGSLRGVFASYVLHLIPDSGLLRLAWRGIQNGGVLAANFHKQQGMVEFYATMCDVGGIQLDIGGFGTGTKHGQYLAYEKS